jgi:hypothetical protein
MDEIQEKYFQIMLATGEIREKQVQDRLTAEAKQASNTGHRTDHDLQYRS